jgi:hypothetical protein
MPLVVRTRRQQWHFEVATEFADKIHGDTGVNASLLVVEVGCRAERKYRLMPDAWIDMDAEGAIAVESDEVRGLHIIAGFGEQCDEGRMIAWREDLAPSGW